MMHEFLHSIPLPIEISGSRFETLTQSVTYAGVSKPEIDVYDRE
jgi:hypothetical protein